MRVHSWRNRGLLAGIINRGRSMTKPMTILLLVILITLSCPLLAQSGEAALPLAPTDVKPGSITYDAIPYPYPVNFLPLTLYGQDVRMAYMDVPPAGQPNV